MTYRTILVELNTEEGAKERLAAARSLGARFDAVLVGMHVVPPVALPVAAGGLSAYMPPEVEAAQRQAGLEARDRALSTFREVCTAEGPEALWREAEGPPGLVLAEAARRADLVIAGRGEPSYLAEWVADDLVTAAGVPVLVVSPGLSAVGGETVLAAWNGRREAARAVHDALPFLQAAGRVVLCAIGERAAAGLEDAAAMLERHRVPVEPERLDGLDAHAGEILLAQAVAHRADLLVMGAYGHSRLRELVLGGATRHVLHRAALPVLLSG